MVAKAVLLVALFLVVPIVLGNVTARVLEAVSPPPDFPLIESLEHTRSLTRMTLLVVAAYYVLLVSFLVGRRLRKRKTQAQ